MAKKSSEPKSLPKAGLAEDILKEIEGEAATIVATESVPEKPTGPEQLFAFADSVNKETGSQESRKAEDKLETWVFFMLAGENYGLPVSHVQEILRVTGITKVPHAPDVVRGVTNMRGRVLPVIDLRRRLGMTESDVQEQSRILVTSSRKRTLGFLVDAVLQVARISRSGIQPPPDDIMTVQSDYIIGVYYLQDQMAIMLDVEKILLIKEKQEHS